VAEVLQTSLRQYLREAFSGLLSDRDFLEALPGHLLRDAVSRQPIRIIVDRMQQMVGS
jgi:hypothetical protein